MFFNQFFNKQEEETLTAKPPGSKIEFITDNSNNFQIVIPSQKANVRGILFLFGITGVLIGLAHSLQYIDFLKEDILAYILIYFPSYVLPILFILLIIIEILFAVSGETVITSKNTWVSLGYILFGVKFFSFYLFPRGSISEIVANRYTKVSQSNPDLDEEITTIVLWAAKTKYELGSDEGALNFSHFTLSTPEMNWLAGELSSCLNLPICEKFWRENTKENSLEFRRIAIIWIVPLFWIISYFLIAIGALGIVEEWPDLVKGFISTHPIAIVLGMVLIIFTFGYMSTLQHYDHGDIDYERLERIFANLVQEGEGEISLELFRRETGLSYEDASTYLAKKVEDLNAVYVKRKGTNNIYYYFKY